MRIVTARFIVLVSSLVFASLAFGGESPMHGYLECQSAANQDTIYFSAIFEGSTGPVGNAFMQFLSTKYGYKGAANCSVADMSYSTIPKLQEGHKAQVAQWRKVGKKVVDTGWTYGGATAIAGAPDQAAATAQGDTNGASPTSGQNVRLWCFALVGSNNTMYVTKGIQYPRTLSAPADKYFGEFIKKTYGAPYSPTCEGGSPDPVQFERGRQARLQDFTRNPRIHIVEVEWTPPSAPPPAAPAAAAKPAAPPKPTQMTYEQALEAERPHSVAPAPAPHSVANDKTYTFCYSTGSPYRGTAKSHYYVTGIFAASDSHAEGPFGVYLRKQHPEEDNHARCILPGPLSTLENTRRTNIEGERKSFPDQDIVELSWKPTT